MQSIESLMKLSMFDRERIEQVVYRLLEYRAQDGDISQYLSEHFVLEVVGDPRHFEYAGCFKGRQAAFDAIRRMNIEIEYLDYELADLLIDGNKAMMRRRVHVRHRGTGLATEHEIWDILRFEDGLVAQITKFIDMQANFRLQGGN